MNIALVEHQGFTKAWYWAPSCDVKVDMVTGAVHVGDGHALRVDPDSKKCIYPTYLHDPKFKAVSDPMIVVSPDIGIYVYKEKSANLPYYPDDAVRLENMYNNVPMIPSHSICFLCKAGCDMRTCSFCLLTSHRDCIDTMVFVFPDAVHVQLPRRFGSGNMCKCCANIKFQNSS